jgi:Cdc6-like AAA superfamily ATPase
MSGSSQTYSLTRQDYLSQILGFPDHVDPFGNPVAEQEITAYGTSLNDKEVVSDPLRYFRLLATQWLRAQVHSLQTQPIVFLFGRPGDGKTTTRFYTEGQYRRELRGVLVVTIEISDIQEPSAFWQTLVHALITDLFIQVIETFHPLDHSFEALESLKQAFRHGGPRLQLLMEQLQERSELDGSRELLGMASLWNIVRRPAMTFIPNEKEVREFVHIVTEPGPVPSTDLSDKSLFYALVDSVVFGTCGYGQLCLLIDGVDDHVQDVNGMMELMEPFFLNIGEWQEHSIHSKFFLPQELEISVERRLQDLSFNFEPPLLKRLTWEEDDLRAVLRHRFKQSKNKHLPLFETIPAMEEAVIWASNRSPRRLLQVMDGLINAHILRMRATPSLEVDDWSYMVETWQYDDDRPLPYAAFQQWEGSSPTVSSSEQPKIPNLVGTTEVDIDLATQEPLFGQLDYEEQFFIRTKLLQYIIKRPKTSIPGLLIYGPTGSGKTWLLRAVKDYLTGNSLPCILLNIAEESQELGFNNALWNFLDLMGELTDHPVNLEGSLDQNAKSLGEAAKDVFHANSLYILLEGLDQLEENGNFRYTLENRVIKNLLERSGSAIQIILTTTEDAFADPFLETDFEVCPIDKYDDISEDAQNDPLLSNAFKLLGLQKYKGQNPKLNYWLQNQASRLKKRKVSISPDIIQHSIRLAVAQTLNIDDKDTKKIFDCFKSEFFNRETGIIFLPRQTDDVNLRTTQSSLHVLKDHGFLQWNRRSAYNEVVGGLEALAMDYLEKS